jgi:4-amino-4-deoxy-L-arabinose transferase-like glycosyltransferase
VLAAEPPQESFGARALRIILWLAIIGALAAAVIYLLARRASRAAAAATVAATHYSLGKR